MFLEISQNSQENTCEFYEICKRAFFTQHLRVTASVLADMIIWTPWKHHNAPEQQNEANKRGNEANSKRHRKSAKKKGRCQNIAKYLTQNKKIKKN